MAKVKKIFCRIRQGRTEIRVYAHAARGGEYILEQLSSPADVSPGSLVKSAKISRLLPADRPAEGS